MSTSKSPSESDVQTDECAYADCTTEFVVGMAVHGSYCSRDCMLRARGQGPLATLRDDHRWCGTCFARLKEIDPAPEDAPECATGLQTLTESATKGERTRHRDDVVDSSDWRTICTCGNTEHDHHEPAFNSDDVRRRARNLVAALRDLAREEKLPHHVDGQAVVRNVHVDGEVSWARAIGAGLDAVDT
ncbi:hypothetical protein U3A55_11810 [Salarchaeum sp. III]|uniref:hypothetical protein n=1 Tax=Salarchaeum sp. III TaxID=3107927 RepID=UPI002ED8C848